MARNGLDSFINPRGKPPRLLALWAVFCSGQKQPSCVFWAVSGSQIGVLCRKLQKIPQKKNQDSRRRSSQYPAEFLAPSSRAARPASSLPLSIRNISVLRLAQMGRSGAFGSVRKRASSATAESSLPIISSLILYGSPRVTGSARCLQSHKKESSPVQDERLCTPPNSPKA